MGYHWFIIFVYPKTFPTKKTADQRPPYVPFGVACLALILVPSIRAIATAWEARRLESLGLLTVILKLAMLYVSLYVDLVSRTVSLMFTHLEWYIHQKSDSDCIVKNLRKLFSGVKLIKRLTINAAKRQQIQFWAFGIGWLPNNKWSKSLCVLRSEYAGQYPVSQVEL